ncbi:Non-canonical poly(A) RNA polymerase protein Trf4-1 [Camellia lanceoleosa]|uniref:Non-canonical poly(A) RNA polymerase protein Trf4-1 n=1 Tax=Camellia lanceoleosa TaxID=1840588 RepID=A0ACC0FTG6_9ERIC|nr:Non-canonical poly(A) RNA polymerase protein Trf4-1 [Camellia lanceoleosa]
MCVGGLRIHEVTQVRTQSIDLQLRSISARTQSIFSFNPNRSLCRLVSESIFTSFLNRSEFFGFNPKVNFFDIYGRKLNTSDIGVSCNGEGTFFLRSSRGFTVKGQPFILSIEDPQAPENDIGKNSFSYF